MEINYKENLISIKINKIDNNICSKFIEEYNNLYLNMNKEKIKTLQFIEEKDCKIVEYKAFLMLVTIIFTKFKKYHDNFIKNIEFIFRTEALNKICRQIFLIYPPQQEYKIILDLKNSLITL